MVTEVGIWASYLNHILIQADQKIIAGGVCIQNTTGYDTCLTRYNPDGTLDNSFGTGEWL